MADGAAEKPPGLTDDHKKKINEWLQRSGGVLRCTVCQQTNWTLYENFVTPTILTTPDLGVVLGGTVYPHFGLVCTTCGHAVFINALASKVLEPKK